MAAMKEDLLHQYVLDLEKLGDKGLNRLLDEGEKWDLSQTLQDGGSAVFPHTFLSECGHQIAPVVQACLDSGTDQVLVLGVVHTLTDEIRNSRIKERQRESIKDSPYWGVFQEVEGEYSLFPFKILWDAEIKRRGIKRPRLIMRYPCLVNREPEKLLGIEELKRISKDSVVVMTGDLNHNGAAYNSSKMVGFGEEGVCFARENILRSFELLKGGNYSDYLDHCYQSINDARDVASVLRYLCGPMSPSILDLQLVDTALNFEGNPTPSWVATALVGLK
ncbi:MAG: hypothetical protein KFB93_07805 [Simkaniaceae bacterium]|nr:MAG: hypothetical protein KFB93_07805 [Simkaniaceae bacterium]